MKSISIGKENNVYVLRNNTTAGFIKSYKTLNQAIKKAESYKCEIVFTKELENENCKSNLQ